MGSFRHFAAMEHSGTFRNIHAHFGTFSTGLRQRQWNIWEHFRGHGWHIMEHFRPPPRAFS